MDTVQEESGLVTSPENMEDYAASLELLSANIPIINITRDDAAVRSTHSLCSQSIPIHEANCPTVPSMPHKREELATLAIPRPGTSGSHRRGSYVSQRAGSFSLQKNDLLMTFPQKKDDMALQLRDSSEPGSPCYSRRPSVIIAALRRPSQAIALSAAQAVMTQRRYLLGLFNGNSEGSIGKKEQMDNKELKTRRRDKTVGDDSLMIILSALYAKLLVVLGMAFPITQLLSTKVEPFFYQGFYLYLYLGSIAFVTYMYVSLYRRQAAPQTSNLNGNEKLNFTKKPSKLARQYGSFYLRLGAIAFGIGSMVYSGLVLGKYFEQTLNPKCSPNILEAISPATRMVLTLVQIQFIFLNSKDMEFNRHRIIARFGLMHMIATNLCQWLYVTVEETKHEMMHLAEHHNKTSQIFLENFCDEGRVMGNLVANSSSFLFPCTIEYSLICAVILFEIWKEVKLEDIGNDKKVKVVEKTDVASKEERVATHFLFNTNGGQILSSDNHFTVDCSNAHRGLFAGIMVIVLTIISLIMFFVLANSENAGSNQQMAMYEVGMVEILLYSITIIAVIIAMRNLRNLKYNRKTGSQKHGQHVVHDSGMGLDNTLLVVAQTGMFIYCMFSIIGCYFSMDSGTAIGLAAEILSFIQTCLQTIFVLDGWWRRCRTIEQTKTKPGREIITFLIIANMAMWTINTMEKNRAEFRPSYLTFFGDWAWTIIKHISMPLAIFYRFHSTICLFEIWKKAYKIKTNYKGPLFSAT